ncbi:hypothetical protein JHE03_23215, partial [Pluralibacter gergoviae]|uniref:hypothetical protein n=1 Tax=Pluralibacter gergoviae TaxID=61647 RepID=UPI00190AFE21
IISTSFCKWLLSFSLNLNPKTTIKLLDAMEYKVLPKSEYPDMLSLALLFTPHPDQITDPSGLALPNAKTEVFHEPTIASNYIDQIGRCTNCDKYLESDPIKREKIINKSITLLNSARFDTREYREKFG